MSKHPQTFFYVGSVEAYDFTRDADGSYVAHVEARIKGIASDIPPYPVTVHRASYRSTTMAAALAAATRDAYSQAAALCERKNIGLMQS